MKWVNLVLVVVVLILSAVLVAQSQEAAWLFHVRSPIVIHSSYSLSSPLVREAQAGETLIIQAPYVQSDDLVWVETADGNWAAVARFGDCTIFSWGDYEPDGIAPVSASPLD